MPQTTIFHHGDVEKHLKAITSIISDNAVDWNKRVDALKEMRSLLLMQVQDFPTFPSYLDDLSSAFYYILGDIQPRVVHEACITIAFMSKTLKNRLDTFAIYIFQALINLIQSSERDISSAAKIAFEYVIRFTHAPKLVPIMMQNLSNSQSKDVRSQMHELINILLKEWLTKSLEKYAVRLKEALGKGIVDGDSLVSKHCSR